MPIMSGFDAARAIRERERIEGRPRVPIIAVTAFALDGDEERCLQAGMDLHVTKPVSRQAIADALERVATHAPAPAGAPS